MKAKAQSEPPQRRESYSLRRHNDRWWLAVYVVLAIPLVATLVTQADTDHWILALAAHFPVQWLVLFCLLGVLFLVRRRWIALALSVFGASLNLWQILPYTVRDGLDTRPERFSQVRVASMNLSATNTDSKAVRRFIAQSDPDIIVLLEITPAWMAALAPVVKTHKYLVAAPDEGYFGIALLSRLPLSKADIVYPGQTPIPTVLAELDVSGTPLALLGVHLDWPLERHSAARQARQLADLPNLLDRLPESRILIGDMNLTPWSAPFRQLLAATGLQDTGLARGLQGTWPSLPFPLSIPIDHCLISNSVAITERTIGPSVGSDHYPLLVEIGLTPRGSHHRP